MKLLEELPPETELWIYDEDGIPRPMEDLYFNNSFTDGKWFIA